jgi:ribosomal protein L11 methyltransferase
MAFLQIKFRPIIDELNRALLIGGLLSAGFDSFSEEDDALTAYIAIDNYHEKILENIAFLNDHPEIRIEIKPLEDINWNKEWESNYEPVTIAGRCHVRAPFHPSLPEMEFEIVIEPKMAFGTAHHETTRLMAGRLMEIDVAGNEVLDMGCGTGVLAILANKMSASGVMGIDNDEWAWNNARENFMINGLDPGHAFLGDASLIKKGAFDIILANINRNVLLQDMTKYIDGLRPHGQLLLSGFYENDILAIRESAESAGLNYSGTEILNHWAVLLFQK